MLEVATLQTSYICISFLVSIFLNIFLNVTVSAIKTCSLKTFKTVIQEGCLYFLFTYAGQYRATVGMFNNRSSAQCSSYNIGYNQSFRNFSSFILVSVIFICLVLFIYSDNVFGVFTLIHSEN